MNVKYVDIVNQVAAVVMTIMMLTVTQLNANGSVPYGFTASNDSIYIRKTYTSSKYRVKLYPDANHQVLFFSASGREGKSYQLFVFDVTGQLVKRLNIRNRETTMLDNMEKGTYLFEVFSNDLRIENGQLFVR